MNKHLLFEWILKDLAGNLENTYSSRSIERFTLEDALFELNNRRKVDLPISLPKKPEKMIPVLRCYGPDYLTTKRTEWMEKKERQKRPVKVSFSFTAYNCQLLDHQSTSRK